jgi:hypothetical protein
MMQVCGNVRKINEILTASTTTAAYPISWETVAELNQTWTITETILSDSVTLYFVDDKEIAVKTRKKSRCTTMSYIIHKFIIRQAWERQQNKEWRN